jgi:hypothetical protein
VTCGTYRGQDTPLACPSYLCLLYRLSSQRFKVKRFRKLGVFANTGQVMTLNIFCTLNVLCSTKKQGNRIRMALKIQAFWGIKHFCWTTTMKAQERLQRSVIICKSKRRNMPDYSSPGQNRCVNLISRIFPGSLHNGVSSLKEEECSPNTKATFTARETCYIQTHKNHSAVYLRK